MNNCSKVRTRVLNSLAVLTEAVMQGTHGPVNVPLSTALAVMQAGIELFPHTVVKTTHSNLMCIHIRKTDFDERNISTDMISTVEAANTIALQTFMIFGDDQEFMENMAQAIIENGNWDKDVVFVSKFEEYIDLYISSKLCKAFLISAVTSTFGWWLAFFAPGQDAIYYMPDTRPHADKRPSEELFL
ncbi:hypothetical protein ANCCEY_05081 [Ancylostoma ceylanicum]|uniref:Uncharacterized protein n=1 Tax=Ancylostoma ceylanicum TaxID=53326 RepID=A0A0D6M0H3_9BILA|nr:hypothetical protein ANCCEY_05081 [Ancylostoma ceylanicum]